MSILETFKDLADSTEIMPQLLGDVCREYQKTGDWCGPARDT
jgi:hypothetical protein